MENLQDFLKVKEAAEFIGVSQSTLRNWEREGKIGTVRHPVNGYRLFRKSDLFDLIRKLREQSDDSTPGGEVTEHLTTPEFPPPPLVIDSLEIHNFRVFEDLVVPQFGRVNLIVGKNNVGKSSLLEAIRLYVHEGNIAVIGDILQSRDESRSPTRPGPDDATMVIPMERLIHDRHRLTVGGDSLEIGPVGAPWDTLSLRMERRPVEPEVMSSLNRLAQSKLPLPYGNDSEDALVITAGTKQPNVTPRRHLEDSGFWRFLRRRWLAGDLKGDTGKNCVFLPARGADPEALAAWWDSITLTRLEDDVLSGLRLLERDVQRLQFIQRSRRFRTPVVGLQGIEGPVPLGSMGDGMNRILAILLALVSAKDGVLLVDEIENGLHYSVQPDLWRLILHVAERANVQVFATTHSWDCIEAFQEAVTEVPGQQGFLVRLVRNEAGIKATVFDERKLTIATREEIEVR